MKTSIDARLHISNTYIKRPHATSSWAATQQRYLTKRQLSSSPTLDCERKTCKEGQRSTFKNRISDFLPSIQNVLNHKTDTHNVETLRTHSLYSTTQASRRQVKGARMVRSTRCIPVKLESVWPKPHHYYQDEAPNGQSETRAPDTIA